jgi:hypothetical protein
LDKTPEGFTPFLDSMIPKSLYWENFISNAEELLGCSFIDQVLYGEKDF